MDKLYHRLWRIFIVVILIISIYFIVKYSILLLYPLIIALIISLFLHPIVTYIEVNWKWKRNIATIFVMSQFFILCGIFSFISIKILMHESSMLVKTLPHLFPKITEQVLDIIETFVKPLY